jgi:hypothetical protein
MMMECEGRLMNEPFTYGITHCRVYYRRLVPADQLQEAAVEGLGLLPVDRVHGLSRIWAGSLVEAQRRLVFSDYLLL